MDRVAIGLAELDLVHRQGYEMTPRLHTLVCRFIIEGHVVSTALDELWSELKRQRDERGGGFNV